MRGRLGAWEREKGTMRKWQRETEREREREREREWLRERERLIVDWDTETQRET